MRNKIDVALHSSKNLNFTNRNDITNKSKINIESSPIQENNKINKLINNFQHNLPNIPINKDQENEPNLMRLNNLNNSHISLYNPLIFMPYLFAKIIKIFI